jgi:hypothetical protein
MHLSIRIFTIRPHISEIDSFVCTITQIRFISHRRYEIRAEVLCHINKVRGEI